MKITKSARRASCKMTECCARVRQHNSSSKRGTNNNERFSCCLSEKKAKRRISLLEWPQASLPQLCPKSGDGILHFRLRCQGEESSGHFRLWLWRRVRVIRSNLFRSKSRDWHPVRDSLMQRVLSSPHTVLLDRWQIGTCACFTSLRTTDWVAYDSVCMWKLNNSSVRRLTAVISPSSWFSVRNFSLSRSLQVWHSPQLRTSGTKSGGQGTKFEQRNLACFERPLLTLVSASVMACVTRR